MARKVWIVTSSRADFDLLRPLIYLLHSDSFFDLTLLVTGDHINAGYLSDYIAQDESLSSIRSWNIDISEAGDSALDVCNSAARVVSGLATYINDNRPWLVVLLGDRSEMLGIAFACFLNRVKVAHIAGGEVTHGSTDDSMRHAITKFSKYHFVASKEYMKRVLQLGEESRNVFNVGSLAEENALCSSSMPLAQVQDELGIQLNHKYVLCTYHPETTVSKQVNLSNIEVLLSSLSRIRSEEGIDIIFTAANQDECGSSFNERIQQFCKEENAFFFQSLGSKRYLSLCRHACFVIGNSSSGIAEIPHLGTPTINIGLRQEGRSRYPSVVDCPTKMNLILACCRNALVSRPKSTSSSHTMLKMPSKLIRDILKNIDVNDEFIKYFADLPQA